MNLTHASSNIGAPCPIRNKVATDQTWTLLPLNVVHESRTDGQVLPNLLQSLKMRSARFGHVPRRLFCGVLDVDPVGCHIIKTSGDGSIRGPPHKASSLSSASASIASNSHAVVFELHTLCGHLKYRSAFNKSASAASDPCLINRGLQR